MSQVQPSRGLRRAVIAFAVIVLLAALTLGIGRLFSLRMAVGDSYPPYSSLRTDPLGSKVLAEAISELPGFSVQRNFRPITRWKGPESATLVYLGIEYDADIDEKEVAAVERLVRNGVRLIVTFAAEAKRAAPAATPGPAFTPGPTPASPPTPTTTPNPPKSAPTPLALYNKPNFHQAAEHWGVSFEIEEDTQRDAVHRIAVPEDAANDLELSVQWHTALYFKGLDPAWSVLYRRDNVPVVIERAFGRGSIVLCTDSYFLSNEGLHTARAPKLIARLVGTPQTVVFDEFHNGVAENPNVAGLVKKHGLGGAVLALFGIAVLFIWKNAAPFLPHRTDDDQGTHVRGFDAGQGFINLLRRGVPTSQLLELCVSEWRKTRGHRAKDQEKAHVDAVLRAHAGRSARDATAAYRTIATGLNRR